MTTGIQRQGVSGIGTSDQAWMLHRRLLVLREEIEARFLDLGRLLIAIRDSRSYEVMGSPTFDAYLASPEVSISPRHGYRCMAVVEAFTTVNLPPVADQTLTEIGIAKADMIAPLVRDADPETVANWVADARVLSRSDLKRKLRDATEGQLPDDREWLEEIAGLVIGKMAKLSRSDAPLNLLDEAMNICMNAIERLKGSGS